MLGPVAAGFLLSKMGAGGCFVVNAVSFLAVIPMIVFVKSHATHSPPGLNVTSFINGIKEAVVYLRRQERIVLSLTLVALTSLCIMPHLTLLPLLVRDILGKGPETLGWMWLSSGLGSILVTVSLGRNFFDTNRKLNILFIGAWGSASCLFVFAFLRFMPALHLFMFLIGAFVTLVSLASQVFIQKEVDSNLRSRILGVWGTLFQGMFPVGSILVGSLAQATSIPMAFMVASATLMVTGLILKLKRS
jgi:predicted MFS family arabinose efflux permease